jgi:hypothetical protein
MNLQNQPFHMSIKTICLSVILALSGIFSSLTAIGQQKSTCVHTLANLEAARQLLLQHIDHKGLAHYEKEALRQINLVISEISAGSSESVSEAERTKTHPTEDDASCLQHCVTLLKKAEGDLRREGTGLAAGLQDRSIKNCEEAIKFIEQIKHN